MKLLTLTLAILIFAMTGCEHTEVAPSADNELTLSIEHQVDNEPMLWDTLRYVNAAGETYSISTLRYYISDIWLHSDGQPSLIVDTILYIDGKQNYSLKIAGLQAAAVDSITCTIGINEKQNVHGKLPLTVENVAMEWPSLMGGGYHFLKLEGHWHDGNTNSGYAIHLGKNPYKVSVVARRTGPIENANQNRCRLVMNINEWLRGPTDFSFSKNGVYTMGSDTLMSLIAENGKDIFTIVQ